LVLSASKFLFINLLAAIDFENLFLNLVFNVLTAVALQHENLPGLIKHLQNGRLALEFKSIDALVE
jgi:hypothetical protein